MGGGVRDPSLGVVLCKYGFCSCNPCHNSHPDRNQTDESNFRSGVVAPENSSLINELNRIPCLCELTSLTKLFTSIDYSERTREVRGSGGG